MSVITHWGLVAHNRVKSRDLLIPDYHLRPLSDACNSASILDATATFIAWLSTDRAGLPLVEVVVDSGHNAAHIVHIMMPISLQLS